MPPAGLPRPDEGTYQTIAVPRSRHRSIVPPPRKPNPGRTDTFRRLNRTEYQNAIRDLLALDVDVASLLPSDESSHGFDNVTVGDLSPTLLERYLSAARKISRLAVGSPVRSPGGDTIMLPPDLTQEEHFDELAARHPRRNWWCTTPSRSTPSTKSRSAWRATATSTSKGLTEPHEVELMLDGERVQPVHGEAARRPATIITLVDQDLNVRIPVKAGPHVVAAAFPKKPSALLETERQPYQAHFNMDRHPRIQPAVYSISVNGPYEAKGPGDTPSRRRIFVCQPAKPGEEEACAKRILSTLMRRAYRRPVTDADLAGRR